MAGAVVNMDNASISNLKDSKLLSLLDNLADTQSKAFFLLFETSDRIREDLAQKEASKNKPSLGGIYQKIVDGSDMKELWNQDEYDKEYN